MEKHPLLIGKKGPLCLHLSPVYADLRPDLHSGNLQGSGLEADCPHPNIEHAIKSLTFSIQLISADVLCGDFVFYIKLLNCIPLGRIFVNHNVLYLGMALLHGIVDTLGNLVCLEQ